MENEDLELGEAEMIQKGVQGLIDCVRDDADNHMNPISPSIGWAPHVLRTLSPSCFRPRVVSIGPLHRKTKSVQAFETQKASYMRSLMSRIKSPQEEILKSCMNRAYPLLGKIKACYDEICNISESQDDIKLVKIMVMDACFILEFMYRILESDEYAVDMSLAQTIICDLVLLENQIPFFFLETIFQCTILKFNPKASLVELLHPGLSFLNLFQGELKTHNISNGTTSTSIDHILSLLYQCYKPCDSVKPNISSSIHSAVDLNNSGVNFKPNQGPASTWAMEMTVKSHGYPCIPRCLSKPTLIMPVFHINDFTELVLRNLIAYEQYSRQTSKYIRSYVYAMNVLVKTPEDVAKLVDSKVLVNNIGTNEEVANVISNICKEVASKDFFYKKQWKTLRKYRESNIAWLRRTYFRSPWNIISLFAGIVLFFLTVVQTLFTINPVWGNK